MFESSYWGGFHSLGTSINDRILLSDNRNLTDAAEVERALKMGEYIKNGATQSFYSMKEKLMHDDQETLALYSLRKYRHLKRTYYPPDN